MCQVMVFGHGIVCWRDNSLKFYTKSVIISVMTIFILCSLLLSQPFPPNFIHRGLQDGRTSHPVCAEFYGGVCWVPGAGKPWKHPAVYAFYHGEFQAGRRRKWEDRPDRFRIKREIRWLLHQILFIQVLNPADYRHISEEQVLLGKRLEQHDDVRPVWDMLQL